jgi:steroid delta-isomerase-like uncharacterized protein
MSETENKIVITRLFEEILNRRKLDMLDDIVAADYIDHYPYPGRPPGPARVRIQMENLFAAFPDVNYSLEDLVAEGELVAVRYILTGTHEGKVMGVEPTGKHVTVRGMDFFRLSGGLIAEYWECLDKLSLLRQLGAVPEPSRARGEGGA